MNPTNFNDFIKSNMNNELPVPNELDWENMNFNLPTAKRKHRKLPWIGFFFFLGSLIMGSVITYIHQTYITQKLPLSKNDSLGIQIQNNKFILKNVDPFLLTATSKDTGKNRTLHYKVNNQKYLIEKQLITIRDTVNSKGAEEKNYVAPIQFFYQNNLKEKNHVLTDISNSKDVEKNLVTKNPSINQVTDSISINDNKSLSLSNATVSNGIEYTKSETPVQMYPSSFDSLEKANHTLLKFLDSFTLYNETNRSESFEKNIPIHIQLSVDSNTKHTPKTLSLIVNVGTNKAFMNHRMAMLNVAVRPAFGNNYQILIERELKDNWLFNIGLGYHRLHTTFFFEKDLGTYVNSQLQVIKKTRQILHNNYFEFVSLYLGVGKQFKFSPRLQGQLLMYSSPSYCLSYSGKSLNDSLSVVAFNANTGVQKKWLLNVDATFRFSYKLKKSDLLFGFNLSQSLTKSNLQTNSNSTIIVQPRILSFNLGIKRSLGMWKKTITKH